MKNWTIFLPFSLVLSACTSMPGESSIEEDIIGGKDIAQLYPEAVVITGFERGHGYFSTGVWIAPRVVLTAAHTVHGSTRFLLSSSQQNPSYTNIETVEADAYDDPQNPYEVSNVSNDIEFDDHDIGLIYVDESKAVHLPQYANPFPMSAPRRGDTVMALGRINEGREGREGLYRSRPLSLEVDLPGKPFFVATPPVSEPGDSGGPLVRVRKGAPTHEVVGVIAGGDVKTYYTNTYQVAEWIRSKVLAHGGFAP